MDARWETIAWFRGEMEHARSETDPVCTCIITQDRIESHLTHGRIVLKQMENSFSLSSSGHPAPPLRGLRSLKS